MYSKNTYGIRANIVVAKAKLLQMRIKDFQHNIQDANETFSLKEKEIAFGSKNNSDVLF